LSTKNNKDEIKYKKYRKVFSKLCKEAELQYYKRMFDSRTNNMKQLGRNLNALLITTNESQVLLPK